jgi:hypothetical protein
MSNAQPRERDLGGDEILRSETDEIRDGDVSLAMPVGKRGNARIMARERRTDLRAV